MAKCGSRFRVLNEHRKSEKQKTFGREKWGIFPRIHLQLQLNSFRTWVVSLEVWILQVMVLEIITWETSTIFQLSFATQDRIFDMHVQLDFWRCRTLRIHVRLRPQHRNTANSNGNQVSRAFCRTQWERILFVCYEGSRVDLAPNITQSSDDHWQDTLSVDHLREIHGGLHSTHGYLLLFTFPPSIDVWKTWCNVFLKKTGYVIEKICILPPPVELSKYSKNTEFSIFTVF